MHHNRRQFLKLGGAAALVVAWPGPADAVATIGGFAFGTYWRLGLGEDVDHQRVRRKIMDIIEATDSTMSPFRPDAEITRINNTRSTDWMPASPQLRQVVGAALRIGRLSGGAFDPTIGPIANRFGFGPITGSRTGSWQQLALSSDAVRKDSAGLTIDLCGIAKGWALDRMAAALDSMEPGGYLIELGGEVLARGRHPSGRAWQIAIEPPFSGIGTAKHLVALEGMAIATSSNTVNAYVIGDRRYSHIIDPWKGEPIQAGAASVSVLTESAMDADAWATALMAMEVDEAISFAQDNGINTLIYARDGNVLRAITTGQFAGSLI